MINRREFLGMALSAGATLALNGCSRMMGGAQTAAAQPASAGLIQRAIPSSGQMVPAVGLSFSNHAACADPVALKEVLKTFYDNGGTVFDAMHVSAASEQFHTNVARELGINDKLFWSVRGAPPGGPTPPEPGPATARAHVEMLLGRLGVPRVGLVMINPQGDPTHLGALKEMKREGLVRHIGVQTIADPGYAAIEEVMRNEPIDFVGVDYDIGNRAIVEDTILPLALERQIGVMAFFPFGNAGGASCMGGTNLFSRTGTRPLPDWAAEFDATTWAQFFLKYVISHPAVTVARASTTKPAHMVDNIGGGIGRLPDEATRQRMAAFIDALPPGPPIGPQPPPPGIALPAAVLDRYVGEYRAASGFTATFRRQGEALFVKPGNNPEAPLLARSETRFQDPRGPFFEFQLDAQGNVTGAILEQQGTQPLTLVRQ